MTDITSVSPNTFRVEKVGYQARSLRHTIQRNFHQRDVATKIILICKRLRAL